MGSMLALSRPSSLLLVCLMETAGTVSVDHVGNAGTEPHARGLCPCQILRVPWYRSRPCVHVWIESATL